MMTTRFSAGLRARPLEARADRDESVIWFLTDLRAAKDDEIEAFPEICLTFVYPKQKVYVDVVDIADVAVIDVLVVVVLDLHDFIAGREGPAEALDLAIAGRI
jgi:hypothetical protein